jgi:hypothetical protein
MTNTPSTEKRQKVSELEPFNKRNLDLTKFKPDLTGKQLQSLFALPGDAAGFPIFFHAIETLSVTKTVGNGRTNLTFVRPTIVQADATVPFAGFDRTVSPTRNPAIQMHFEPSAYGITTVASYLMIFTIECFGQSTFRLEGFAGAGTLSNNGTKVLSGQKTVTLVFNNVPPSEQIFGFLEQTAGERWNWVSVQARFPFPVVASF